MLGFCMVSRSLGHDPSYLLLGSRCVCLITTITAVAAISATSAMVGIVITTTAIISLVNSVRVLGLASRI